MTNAASQIRADFWSNRLLQGFAATFLLAWLASAIAPLQRFDWFLENLLLFVAVGGVVYFYRSHPLSDLSYLLVLIFTILHVLGTHYTYSKVPVGFWIQDFLAQDRNHFDRLVHFAFGLLLAYPVRETLMRYCGSGRRLSAFSTFTTIAAASLVYETIEWLVAMVISPDAAMAFLGTQGDVFDAQKDATLAMTGCLLGLFFKSSHFSRPAM
jgi:putative membrane protein